MYTFFYGWRRKAGIVTLVMACILMVGWMRSRSTDDVIVLKVGRTWIFNFVSNQCGLGFRAAAYGTDISSISAEWLSHPIDRSKSTNPMDNVFVPTRIDFCDFHLGCHGINVFQDRYFAICFISYWYAIFPLTLISAYLIFWKPRKKA